MARIGVNTTIDKDLYNGIRTLALQISIENDKKVNANDLIEEGMRLVLEKYKDKLEK